MKTQSKKRGKNTLEAEILNISQHGIWILIDEKEYFMDYDRFPWFKNATVGQILNFKIFHNHHFHWPDLDIDLDLDNFKNREKYPLTYKKN